jgi:hypothetical protein
MASLSCIFGKHDWRHVDHFPDGDSFPDGYVGRRCHECGKVQWNLISDFKHSTWVNGWPRRDNKPPMPPRGGTGVRSVEIFRVVINEDPGLTDQEKGVALD